MRFVNTLKTTWRACLLIVVQVVFYSLMFLFSQDIVKWLALPLPANIVGMLLMLMLFMLHLLPLSWVKAGANWLLTEMLLFFIPAVVAVVNYSNLLLVDGLRILLVIIISTLLVLGTTALVVDKVYSLETKRAQRRQAGHD